MKNFTLLLSVILMTISCSQYKIAFIDTAFLMKDYEGLKAFDQDVKNEQDKLRKEVESLIEPYQLKVDEYYKNVDKMSASARTAIELELQQEQDAIEAQQEKFKQQLEKRRLDGLEVINKEITDFVENYAKSNGFQLVFASAGAETVIYGEARLDITQEVLTELNRLYNEKK